jgi:hypothetical protein
LLITVGGGGGGGGAWMVVPVLKSTLVGPAWAKPLNNKTTANSAENRFFMMSSFPWGLKTLSRFQE